MHPFRIAILIFVIGASVANLLLARLQHDRIAPPTALPVYRTRSSTPTPTATPAVDLMATSKPNLWGTDVPDAFATIDPEQIASNHREHKEVTDRALLRETVILTVAGIAWFLVPVKPKQA